MISPPPTDITPSETTATTNSSVVRVRLSSRLAQPWLMWFNQLFSLLQMLAFPQQRFVPSSLTLVTGTYDSGNLASVQTMCDGNTYMINEVVGPPGFEVDFGFTNIPAAPTHVICRCWYDGNLFHDVHIDVYSYTAAVWSSLTQVFQSGSDYTLFNLPTPDFANYTDGNGHAKVRIYHDPPGNTAHTLNVDYVALVCFG